MSSTGSSERLALRDGTLDVTLRRNPRARRISLRVDPRDGRCILVLPPHASKRDALAFARRNAAWIRERQSRVPPKMALAPGTVLPYRGIERTIEHDAGSRDPVRLTDGRIVVGGRATGIETALRRWLVAAARTRIEAAVGILADRVERQPGRITIRDTRSRWGSCAANGNLSFCWRLILAPDRVLDYVVAHEIAHLEEMNHGPRFWSLVERLHGPWHADSEWLARHGARLHRYG